MNPQKELDEAQQKRDQAAALLREADELEEDANERMDRARRLLVRINDIAMQEKEAAQAGDQDRERELATERVQLERERDDVQGGASPIL